MVGTSLVSTPDALCKFGSATSPLTVINSTTGSCTSLSIIIAQDAPFRIALNGVTFTTTGPTFYYYNVTALSLDVPRGPATGATPIYIRLTSTGTVNHPGNVAIVMFTSQTNGAITPTVSGTVVADPNAPSGFSVLTSSPDTTQYSFSYPTIFTLTISLNGGFQFLSPVSPSFEYYVMPAVTGLSLAGVPADNAAGTSLTIIGVNYRSYPQSLCKISMTGGLVLTLPTIFEGTSGLLTVTLPALAGASVAGPAIFEVSLNDGRQYTHNGKGLTLFVVSGVVPSGGPLTGGTVMVVSGSGFASASTMCKVGGGTPSQATFISSSMIACSSSPGHALGAAGVTVSMDAVRYSSPTAASFIYYGGATFERLTPSSAPSNATTGLATTISGRSFPVLPSVQPLCKFGTVVTTSNSSSNSTIICPLPLGPVGKVAVSVAFNGLDFEGTGLLFDFVPPTSGLVCSPGSVPDPSTGTCVVCAAGLFSNDGTSACQPCPKGRYSASNASTTCEVCAAGHVAAREGSTGCVACGPGSYTATNESSVCLPCEQGRFAPGNASITCDICQAGTIASGQGSTACSPCAPGSFAAKNESSVCVACPPGQYASNSSSTGCEVCPVGKVARAAGLSSCTSCPRGTLSVEGLTTSCTDCPSGTYSDVEEARECKVCPRGTFSVGVPSSAESCVCKPGFFEKDGRAGVECTVCPEGGFCPGGTVTASAKPGYWSSPTDVLAFIACSPPSSCPGGGPASCSEGFSGRMCSQCLPGWYRTKGTCSTCPKGSVALVIAFSLVSALIVGLLIWGAGSKRKKAAGFAGTVGVATQFFQILAIVTKLDFSWPERVKNAASAVTALFTLKLDVFAPECSAPSITYVSKWSFMMLLPLVFAVPFAAVFLFGVIVPRFSHLRPKAVNAYLTLFMLGYMSLANTALEPFGCKREVDQTYTLVPDPSLACFDPWWRRILPFAATCSMFYVAGVPITMMMWLVRNRRKIGEANRAFESYFGSLFLSYRHGIPFWGAAVMVENIMIAAAGLFLNQFIPLQIVALLSIFMLSIVINLKLRPFVRPSNNTLQIRLRACLIAVLLAGIIFYVGRGSPTSTLTQGTEIVAVILIALGILFIAGTIVAGIQSDRLRARVTLPPVANEVLCPRGLVLANLWLSSSPAATERDGVTAPWQERFFAILHLVPGNPGDLWPLPIRLADDILALYTCGVFRQDVIPFIRTRTLTDSSFAAEVISCFHTFGSFLRAQGLWSDEDGFEIMEVEPGRSPSDSSTLPWSPEDGSDRDISLRVAQQLFHPLIVTDEVLDDRPHVCAIHTHYMSLRTLEPVTPMITPAPPPVPSIVTDDMLPLMESSDEDELYDGEYATTEYSGDSSSSSARPQLPRRKPNPKAQQGVLVSMLTHLSPR